MPARHFPVGLPPCRPLSAPAEAPMTLTELLEKYGDKWEFMPLYVGVAA
ncbi:hypothetical protein HD595_001545 [Nonomuraea roseoviolacea subsp. carminata]|uniref:Uncharacterized protein n=1 Tax=Nonomuraea roseoviolacea subsp. carminata TaxID=160689 RepID=A0ABT1JUL0_9ACTN|nr:hypothetical protein [Nonomuraea roseoviolacea subsp. carminata]